MCTIRAPSHSVGAHTVFTVHIVYAPFVHHHILSVHIQYLKCTHYVYHSCTITFPRCTYSIYGTHIMCTIRAPSHFLRAHTVFTVHTLCVPFVHHHISFCAPFVHRSFCSVSNDTLFKCTIYDFNTLKPIFITEFALFCAHMRCTKRNFLCVQNAPSADRQRTGGFW
jgi:hypothetical protein